MEKKQLHTGAPEVAKIVIHREKTVAYRCIQVHQMSIHVHEPEVKIATCSSTTWF